MSSNPYHNNPVTRSNYEEYFMLYVDDELTAEEKAAVDQFLLLNPDLIQELEQFQQAKLPLEFMEMEEKESLLSGQMKVNTTDEALLLYVDNELNEEERSLVEAKLHADAAFRSQYELLLKTRSDAGEAVACPFKEELYRPEERRVPVLWWRIAAAVLVVVSMGTFLLTSQNGDHQSDTVATRQQEQRPAKTNTNTEVIKETAPVETLPDVAEQLNLPAERVEAETPVLAMQQVEKRTQENKEDQAPEPSTSEEGPDLVYMPQRPDNDPVLIPEKVEAPVRKPLTKDPVTPDKLYAFNHTDAPVNTVPADADETEKSKASLKGLLRTATRFVERRTKINVTNEDEELLIGSVAISLK